MNLDTRIQLLSNTPIIHIQNNQRALSDNLNITGSIKIKPAFWMLRHAKQKNLIQQKTILEASSGNTAIALAYLCKLRKFSLEIILPKNTAQTKKNFISNLGTQVTEIPGTTDDAIIHRNERFTHNQEKYFLIDQYQNFDNMEAHYHITGPQIWREHSDISIFIAGLGTSGTITGTAKFLKQKNPKIKIIGVAPQDKIEGLRNFETTKVTIPFWEEHKHLIDDIIYADTEQAQEGQHLLSQKGLLLGPSSGANFYTSIQVSKQYPGQKIIRVAADGGERYMGNNS